MELKEGSVLYVRIDHKIGNKVESEQDAQASMEYLQKLAQERYLIAGLFGTMEMEEIEGAMIIFEAENLAEAKKICENDPLIKRGFYRYEVQPWYLMVLPEITNK